MKYRCTARFARGFDRLEADARAEALRMIRQFHFTPRVPSRDVRLLLADGPQDVWTLPFGPGYALTYSFEYGSDEDNFVCVLRVIGRTEEMHHEDRRPDR